MRQAEQRGAIEASLRRDTERSDEWHARRIGCWRGTVRSARMRLIAAGEIADLESLIRCDGRSRYPAHRPAAEAS
jgi:hypothetical protein